MDSPPLHRRPGTYHLACPRKPMLSPPGGTNHIIFDVLLKAGVGEDGRPQIAPRVWDQSYLALHFCALGQASSCPQAQQGFRQYAFSRGVEGCSAHLKACSCGCGLFPDGSNKLCVREKPCFDLSLNFLFSFASFSSLSNSCDAEGSGSARTTTQMLGLICSRAYLLHSLNVACWITSSMLRYLVLHTWYTQAQCSSGVPIPHRYNNT